MPFDLIFDRDLHDLHRYKTVILPHSECFSDEQLALLKAYLSAGGSLVLIGRVAAYDEWRRVRVASPLRDLGLQDEMDGLHDHATPGSPSNAPVQLVKRQFGSGRVAYLSSLEFDGPLPPPRPDFAIRNEFWKLPKNWEELISLLTWASNGNIPLELDAPAGVIAELKEQKLQRRTYVHVLNYNVAKVPVQHDIPVRIQLPAGARPIKATVRTPESGSETTIPVVPAASQHIRVPFRAAVLCFADHILVSSADPAPVCLGSCLCISSVINADASCQGSSAYQLSKSFLYI